MGKAVSLENNSGKGVLNPLFICDIKRCTKNRISVKTVADESMSEL